MRLLLLSNSTNAGQSFLEHAEEALTSFLGKEIRRVLFVPFAAVSFSYDDYAAKARERFEALGYELASLHEASDPVAAVEEAECIVVGGGNTFHLVHGLYEAGLMDAVRRRVHEGAPYVGWSAGANVACPGLWTTNDMPIIEPPSFATFGLVPFQINPHYVDAKPEGHMGESRADRIREFVVVHPEVSVVGLPEGTWLRVEGERIELQGERPARVFRGTDAPREVGPGEELALPQAT